MAPAPNAAAGPSKPAGAAGGTAQVTALQKDIFLKLKNAKEQVSRRFTLKYGDHRGAITKCELICRG